MHLVVGLGNPGPKYAGHRHNVGFMVVDRLADRHGLLPFREKFKGVIAKGRVAACEAVLLKPMGFMNLSGESVGPAAKFFKVPLSDVVVIHDELDLPFGTVRIKVGGGTAGHNGLKSIVSHGEGPGFVRIRVGIGRPRGGGPVERWVLSDFSSDERIELDSVLESASAALEDVLQHGPQSAMNRPHTA